MEEDMPDCPTICGGRTPRNLTPAQASARVKYGCDEPCEQARYAILCPACDGAGCSNDGREERDPRYCYTGHRYMRRCPASHQTPDLVRGVRAYRWLTDSGIAPAPGAMLDQAASFVQLCSVIDAERGRVDSERMDQARKRSEADRRRANNTRRK